MQSQGPSVIKVLASIFVKLVLFLPIIGMHKSVKFIQRFLLNPKPDFLMNIQIMSYILLQNPQSNPNLNHILNFNLYKKLGEKQYGRQHKYIHHHPTSPTHHPHHHHPQPTINSNYMNKREQSNA